jgi:hypothetical protein
MMGCHVYSCSLFLWQIRFYYNYSNFIKKIVVLQKSITIFVVEFIFIMHFFSVLNAHY